MSETIPNRMSDFRGFMFRDCLVLGTTLLFWYFARDTHPLTTGILTGVCALLLHEYGHLFGAVKSQAVITPAPLWSPFIFNLNPNDNNRRQQLSTSCWGFVATAVFVTAFTLFLPNTPAGKIALFIGLGLATLTVVIEFPIAWRMARGKSVPDLSLLARRNED